MYAPPQTGNNNIHPPTNPPLYSDQLNGGVNPGYGAQVKVAVNAGVSPTNVKVNNTSPQVEPMAVSNNIEPDATEPLISSPNPLWVKLKSCSSNEHVPQFTFGQNACFICSGIIFLILCLNCLMLTVHLEGISIGIFLSLDIIYIVYGVFFMLSVLKVRLMRYISTLLSPILLFLGLIIAIIGLLKIGKLPEDLKKHSSDFAGFTFARLVWLFIMLHTLFHYNWGITICKCLLEGSSRGSSSETNNGNGQDNNESNDNNNNDNSVSNNDHVISSESSSTYHSHHQAPSATVHVSVQAPHLIRNGGYI
jgi:hypothetical protein